MADPPKRSSRSKELHASSRIEEIPLDHLRADTSYQRVPSQELVDYISDNWDEVASELILVSDRGKRPETSEVAGGLFVVNGQHRFLAARKLGLKEIPARVIDLRKEEDPAKIEAGFRIKTNVRRGDASAERFKAQLRAGNEDSIGLVKLLARLDTEINLTIQAGSGINCVSALENLYANDPGLLQETLEVIRDSLHHLTPRTVTATNLKAFSWFILQHGMESNRDRLVNQVAGIGRSALDQRGRTMQSTMLGPQWINVYRVLVDSYNEGLAQKNRMEIKTRGSAIFSPDRGRVWGKRASR